MSGGSFTPAQVGVLSENFLYPGSSRIFEPPTTVLASHLLGCSTSTGLFGTVGAGPTACSLSPVDQLVVWSWPLDCICLNNKHNSEVAPSLVTKVNVRVPANPPLTTSLAFSKVIHSVMIMF